MQRSSNPHVLPALARCTDNGPCPKDRLLSRSLWYMSRRDRLLWHIRRCCGSLLPRPSPYHQPVLLLYRLYCCFSDRPSLSYWELQRILKPIWSPLPGEQPCKCRKRYYRYPCSGADNIYLSFPRWTRYGKGRCNLWSQQTVSGCRDTHLYPRRRCQNFPEADRPCSEG